MGVILTPFVLNGVCVVVVVVQGGGGGSVGEVLQPRGGGGSSGALLARQLAQLLCVGQGLEHGVLPLQHRVPLVQLLDLLLQHLHLLAHGVHQVALDQVL